MPSSPRQTGQLIQPALSLFDTEAALQQRNSKDLVLYCTSLQIIVRAEWPTVGGNPVPAEHIPSYLNREHLYWSCFCPLETDYLSPAKLPCRFLSWTNGPTVALCHYDKPRCQFFLSLDKISSSTTVHAPYKNLPILTQHLLQSLDGIHPNPIIPASRTYPGYAHPVLDPLLLTGYLGEIGPGSIARTLVIALIVVLVVAARSLLLDKLRQAESTVPFVALVAAFLFLHLELLPIPETWVTLGLQ
ncbi:hypothetical protein C8R43DRAFT_1123502 [Mycena crocata]|nr:hypothetical protein C8R43DRAFT_1123502 [Mycena crocata]